MQRGRRGGKDTHKNTPHTLTHGPQHNTHQKHNRVFARSGWGEGQTDFVTEDYIRLEDEGNVCVTRQTIRVYATGATGTQYVVGRYAGLKPPPGH